MNRPAHEPAADLSVITPLSLSRAGLRLAPDQVGVLRRYLQALLGANKRLNLTRITDPPAAVLRHLVEPLLGWEHLAGIAPAGPIVDVGSGGGSPGLPIAIVAPDRAVTLLEARRRKAAFLQETVAALGLRNVRVVHERAEAFGHGDERESFAVALTRALAPLPAAFELLLPLVANGGLAAIYSGPSVRTRLPAAAASAAALGAEAPQPIPIHWPGSDRDLLIVTTRKHAPTPARYPRTIRQIRRAPLGAE